MAKKVKIKDIGKVVTGKTPSKRIDEYWNKKDIPFLKPDDLSNNINLLKSYKTYISKEGYSKSNKIPKNSVIVSCIGTIGKVGINNIDIATNQQINCIIPNEDMDSKYLMYQMFSKKNYLNDIANAPVVPIINKTTFENIEISKHPLEKQNQIAKTLDKANELIELRKESITKLDALAKSIFIDMFGDPVSNPKGWERIPFDKLIEIKPKSIKPENIQDFDRYVGLENIERDLGNLININNAINEDLKSNKFSFDENTILYGKLRPYLNKVALPNFSGVCSTDILPIKVLNANKLFIVFIIRHNSFVEIMTSRATGANLPRVNKSDLLAQEVFNPPTDLQNKFAKIIEKIEEQKTLYTKELEKLQINFDALLQKSFQE